MSIQNSKENIRNRIYKHAASYLGIKKIETLDPLVKLLLEGLSSELFTLSQDMEDSNQRMLDRVAEILTPDFLVSHRPAHGIAHIRCSQSNYLLRKDTGLFCDSIENNNTSETTTFYPIEDTYVLNGDICRILYMGNIYSMDASMTKECIAHVSFPPSTQMEHVIWIGLELSGKLENLEMLSFFFNFPNRNDKQKLYSLLPYANWSINGIPLNCAPEYKYKKKYTQDIFEIYDIEKGLVDDIKTCYRNQFYHLELKQDLRNVEMQLLPEEVKEYYPETFCNQQKQSLYWFKVELPVQLDTNSIKELQVNINAVIIENKHLNTSVTEVNNQLEIIPLNIKSNEYYLSISAVKDSHDRSYWRIPKTDKQTQESGIYSLKQGGCERLNLSELKRSLSRQIDMIYDHSSLISTADKNMFLTQMNKINDALETISKNLSNIDMVDSPHSYLMVETLEKAEFIYISYWSTLCEVANNISAGYQLSALDATLPLKKIVFLTSTRGGKSIPRNDSHLSTYKYMLTSHDRIFTESDILNYCWKELGDIIASVEIKKGFIESEIPGEGVIRSLTIHLELKEDTALSTLEDFKNKLIARSPSSFNYRIISSNINENASTR